MELKLKTEFERLKKGEEDIEGLGVFYEKDEDLKDGFNITFNTLYGDKLEQVDEGVRLSKDSATVLHGFLTAILKL